jgi:hypothetical protein
MLFSPQPALLILNPVKWHVFSVRASHPSDACFKAQKMSIEEKRDIAKRKGCYFAYLKTGHVKRRSRALLKYIFCEGKHVPVMCTKVEKASETNIKSVVESSLPSVNGNQVFLQITMVKL